MANYNCQAIKQVLDTHYDIEVDDILWATDVICQQNYSIEQLAQILVHINLKTYIGRLSWVLNSRLLTNIKDRNSEKLIQAFQILWPEFEILMSERDRQRLDKIKLSETTATLMVLQSKQCLNGDCKALLFPCRSNFYESMVDLKNNAVDKLTIYQKCLEKICLYEQHETGNKNAIISSSNLFPSESYIMDDMNDSNRRTCYSHDQIMEMMSNPKYNTAFLNMRFGLDHSLYKKSQEILAQQ